MVQIAKFIIKYSPVNQTGNRISIEMLRIDEVNSKQFPAKSPVVLPPESLLQLIEPSVAPPVFQVFISTMFTV